jgi:hypothetical protein
VQGMTGLDFGQCKSMGNNTTPAGTVKAARSYSKDAVYPDLHHNSINDGVLQRRQDAILLGYSIASKRRIYESIVSAELSHVLLGLLSEV